MCVYCWLADWMHQYTVNLNPLPSPVQPWSPWNQIPSPVPQPQPWTRDQYDQAVKILQCVKGMEDKLGGCPDVDPSKMDFLKEIEQQLNSERKPMSQLATIILFANKFQIIDPPELIHLLLSIVRDKSLSDEHLKMAVDDCYQGWYVLCSVSGEQIPLNLLKYWDVERQEVYARPELVPALRWFERVVKPERAVHGVESDHLEPAEDAGDQDVVEVGEGAALGSG